MKQDINKKLFLIWKFLKGSKYFFVISIISATLAAFIDMIIPQIIRITIDIIIQKQDSNFTLISFKNFQNIDNFSYLRDNLWIISLIIIGIALIKIIFQYMFYVYNAKGAETLSKTTRDSLFSHIIKLPYLWHRENKTGDIIQRCTSDISTMNTFVTEEMTSIFRVVILLSLSIIFMLKMNISLTLIALSIFPIIILNSILFDRKIEKDFKNFDEGEGKLSSILQENLTGVRIVRAFGQENNEFCKFKNHNQVITKIGVNIGKSYGLFLCVSDILSGIQIMLVIVFGAIFCIKKSMTPGEYIAFISYNTMLSWPLNELGRMISELGKTSVSIDRIRYIMESPIEQNHKNSVKPNLKNDIVFDNVTFSYGNVEPILKNINFTIKAGSTLGILGGTGSGKSTLMLLLDKIYNLNENDGKIMIGNVDIKEIDTEYLRKNIGIVLQDPYLFSRTIEENINISNDDININVIEQATKDACMDTTISSFSKGYKTIVGERGVTLSGGQKQRIAIARILTQNTPIMIFDDSLSAVDTETDAKIRNSLEKRFGNATIILISQRISTLSKTDKIIVLDNGKIKEEGTHQELLSQNGIYRKIYDIQTIGKEHIK